MNVLLPGRLTGILLVFISALFTFFFCSLASADDSKSVDNRVPSHNASQSDVIRFLTTEFEQLPEQQISISRDRSVYAHYAQPVTRYSHDILGDAIEAEKLVVFSNGRVYTHELANDHVFEDIKPRLFDVDMDGLPEIITIRTHVAKGAGIMIYKIQGGRLTEFSWVEEIGRSFRWLNIAAIYDLDNDGVVELAWIQTPHIGGILKVARIKQGKLEAIDELSGYSNHAIGERNLCLSVVTNRNNITTLYVPTQNRRQIVGFRLSDGQLKKTAMIRQVVNFSSPLVSQYDFTDIVKEALIESIHSLRETKCF